MKKYPAIEFILKYGSIASVVFGIIPALVAIFLAVYGYGYAWIAAGIVGGGIVYIVVKSYVELVEILSDMLMPR